MGQPIIDILKYLETRDETLQSMVAAFEDCSNPARADQLIKEVKSKEDEYTPDFRAAEKRPFCSILTASALFIRGRYPQALKHLKDAERGFNCSGQEWNLAMSRWMLGLFHMQVNQLDLAKQKFEDAASLLKNLSRQYRRIGRYDKAEESLALVERIQEAAPETTAVLAQLAKPSRERPRGLAPRPVTSPPAAVPPGELIFPIYDPVRAGKGGNFIFDSQPQGQAAISELTIDDKPFRVFSMRAGEPVTLHPRIHRWLYVAGNSMDQATPHPLIEGDCILVVETGPTGLRPQANDIVVAALTDPSSPLDRAGVVKRYTSAGLCSESSQAYPPIPLKKVKVKGIVLAVAKPVDRKN